MKKHFLPEPGMARPTRRRCALFPSNAAVRPTHQDRCGDPPGPGGAAHTELHQIIPGKCQVSSRSTASGRVPGHLAPRCQPWFSGSPLVRARLHDVPLPAEDDFLRCRRGGARGRRMPRRSPPWHTSAIAAARGPSAWCVSASGRGRPHNNNVLASATLAPAGSV